ncbi:MAG: cytochrome P450 [Solirubrobacteraceae bacterium]
MGTLRALARAAIRELLWGLSGVSGEVERWRRLAASITDQELRDDALQALDGKRLNIDGAALFWTLPRARSRELLRLLVAFEVLADYLDCTSERGAHAGTENGLQLHRALVEALDPQLAISEHYRLHPWRDDGGYVRALIDTCREACMRLPSYESVRPLVVRAARLAAQVLAFNHEPDPSRRDAALRAWANTNFVGGELAWFEWTASASAWLTILALLALAADSGRRVDEAEAVYAAYLPWVSLLGTMLDSYGDLEEDAAHSAHSYLAHYPSTEIAAARLTEIIRRSLREAAALPDGTRHVVIASGMVAMYVSKETVRTTRMRPLTKQLTHAGGWLTWLLVPVLRAWRVLYRQRTAKEASGMPTSKRALPPSPHLPAIVQTLAFWRDPHAYLTWCRRRYGKTFVVRAVGSPPLVFMSHHADIKAIVRASADVLHPGAGGTVIEPLVGEGSFMLADEDEHLRGRRAIMPAFHQRAIADHADVLREIVAREVASWPRDIPIAIHPRLRALTLQIILRTIFGEHARERELHARLFAMFSVTASLVLQEPQLRYLPGWRSAWRSFLVSRADVEDIIRGLIEEEARLRTQEQSVLSMLLDAGELDRDRVDTAQIRDTVMSLILAGHETTASELAWAFQLLAHNPFVAECLVDDLDAGSEQYLTATIEEVLRHRPVFLFAIPRVVRKPFEIAGSTYRPPVHLVGCIHLMHHDPNLYPEPDTFRPERFLQASPPPDIWLPWGGGRKRCPGHHLAMLEMRTILRTVLSDLHVEPVGNRVETARWRSVIVTPENGSRIILKKRRRQHSHDLRSC